MMPLSAALKGLKTGNGIPTFKSRSGTITGRPIKEKEVRKMKKLVIALLCSLSLLVMGGVSFAQNNQWITATPGALYQPSGWKTLEASWWIGYQVMDPSGTPLGQISNLVIDKENGRVVLVLLSDVPGAGNQLVAVPYSSIVRTGEHTFQLSFGGQSAGFGVSSGYVDRYVSKMERLPSDLQGVPSVIEPQWVSGLYSYYGQAPYWKQKGEKPLATMELFESSTLIGAEVQTPKGEGVARINDLAINSRDGRVAFLVLDHVAGRPDTMVAVPFSELSRRSGNVYVLNTTKDKLASAPTFDRHTDMNNIRFAEQTYRYFGLSPSWIERDGRMVSSTKPEAPVRPMTRSEYIQMYGY
jgi:sporulation protein YlmC with PRC-barrel domain